MISKEEYEQTQKVVKQYEAEQLDLLRVSNSACKLGRFPKECSIIQNTSFKNGKTENEYSKNNIYKLWEKRFSQYDGLKVLLNSVFGKLYCGGVAYYHYGQCNCSEEQWNVVMNWNSGNDKTTRQSL